MYVCTYVFIILINYINIFVELFVIGSGRGRGSGSSNVRTFERSGKFCILYLKEKFGE